MKAKNYKEQYQRRKARQSAAKNFNKYGILVGNTYGNYKVLEKIKVPQKVKRKSGEYVECMATKWRCEYIPDGSEKITTTGYLSQFKEKEIQDEELKKLVDNNEHQKGFRHFLYSSYKKNAKARGHNFCLTEEEFEDIIFKDCYYCGEPPKPMSDTLIKNRGNTKQPPLSYNGIDRLDCEKDYTIENCVPCCSKCNYMKHTSSKIEFLSQITKIYTHLNLGSTTIPKGSTPQADGGGNGGPLTDNAEGEDIV